MTTPTEPTTLEAPGIVVTVDDGQAPLAPSKIEERPTLTGPACGVCLRPLPPGRDVPYCGQSCRGLLRAIEKNRDASAIKRNELRRAADEKAEKVAKELGFTDRWALRHERAWQLLRAGRSVARPATVLAQASRLVGPDDVIAELDNLDA